MPKYDLTLSAAPMPFWKLSFAFSLFLSFSSFSFEGFISFHRWFLVYSTIECTVRWFDFPVWRDSSAKGIFADGTRSFGPKGLTVGRSSTRIIYVIAKNNLRPGTSSALLIRTSKSLETARCSGKANGECPKRGYDSRPRWSWTKQGKQNLFERTILATDTVSDHRRVY